MFHLLHWVWSVVRDQPWQNTALWGVLAGAAGSWFGVNHIRAHFARLKLLALWEQDPENRGAGDYDIDARELERRLWEFEQDELRRADKRQTRRYNKLKHVLHSVLGEQEHIGRTPILMLAVGPWGVGRREVRWAARKLEGLRAEIAARDDLDKLLHGQRFTALGGRLWAVSVMGRIVELDCADAAFEGMPVLEIEQVLLDLLARASDPARSHDVTASPFIWPAFQEARRRRGLDPEQSLVDPPPSAGPDDPAASRKTGVGPEQAGERPAGGGELLAALWSSGKQWYRQVSLEWGGLYGYPEKILERQYLEKHDTEETRRFVHAYTAAGALNAETMPTDEAMVREFHARALEAKTSWGFAVEAAQRWAKELLDTLEDSEKARLRKARHSLSIALDERVDEPERLQAWRSARDLLDGMFTIPDRVESLFRAQIEAASPRRELRRGRETGPA